VCADSATVDVSHLIAESVPLNDVQQLRVLERYV
jgi:hypothetical protein